MSSEISPKNSRKMSMLRVVNISMPPYNFENSHKDKECENRNQFRREQRNRIKKLSHNRGIQCTNQPQNATKQPI